jgi:hypothetical protein
MTEERKHAILLATSILTARKLQPLLEEDFAVSTSLLRGFYHGLIAFFIIEP